MVKLRVLFYNSTISFSRPLCPKPGLDLFSSLSLSQSGLMQLLSHCPFP